MEDWEKLRQHSEDHFPLVFSRLVKGYDALGDAAGAQAVIDYALNRFPTSEVVEQAMKRAFKDKGQQAAAEIVSKGLSGHPTLGTLSVAMEFRKMIAPDDEQLQGLSEMLKKESDRQGRYQCRPLRIPLAQLPLAVSGLRADGIRTPTLRVPGSITQADK